MRKSKKFVSLGLALMLSAGLLTGCGSKATKTEKASETESVQTCFDQYDTKPENRIYEPYTQTFAMRVKSSMDSMSTNNEVISYMIPEGYCVTNTIPVFWGRGDTYGYDVFFTNTETVEVEPVYDKNGGYWCYANFGNVVELEETSTLTK